MNFVKLPDFQWDLLRAFQQRLRVTKKDNKYWSYGSKGLFLLRCCQSDTKTTLKLWVYISITGRYQRFQNGHTSPKGTSLTASIWDWASQLSVAGFQLFRVLILSATTKAGPQVSLFFNMTWKNFGGASPTCTGCASPPIPVLSLFQQTGWQLHSLSKCPVAFGPRLCWDAGTSATFLCLKLETSLNRCFLTTQLGLPSAACVSIASSRARAWNALLQHERPAQISLAGHGSFAQVLRALPTWLTLEIIWMNPF